VILKYVIVHVRKLSCYVLHQVSLCDVPGSKDPTLEQKIVVNSLDDLLLTSICTPPHSNPALR